MPKGDVYESNRNPQVTSVDRWRATMMEANLGWEAMCGELCAPF